MWCPASATLRTGGSPSRHYAAAIRRSTPRIAVHDERPGSNAARNEYGWPGTNCDAFLACP